MKRVLVKKLLLKPREAMAVLGIDRQKLKTFQECGLLKPVRLARLVLRRGRGRRYGRTRAAAWYRTNEVLKVGKEGSMT